MKTILFAILGALLGFLMGAFYNVGFDISLWSEGSRFVTLLAMMICGMFGAWLKMIDEAYK
jgi:hypothetical protein